MNFKYDSYFTMVQFGEFGIRSEWTCGTTNTYIIYLYFNLKFSGSFFIQLWFHLSDQTWSLCNLRLQGCWIFNWTLFNSNNFLGLMKNQFKTFHVSSISRWFTYLELMMLRKLKQEAQMINEFRVEFPKGVESQLVNN